MRIFSFKKSCLVNRMSFIEKEYHIKCGHPSDINEHLPTLRHYASDCTHVTECGVRGAVSCYALGNGIRGKKGARIVLVDLNECDAIDIFVDHCENEGINATFYADSDLKCPIEDTEMLFIDTWHVYGHLKRELSRWHSHVKKYILLHDTTVDGEYGESIRLGWNILEQSKDSGLPVEEVAKGLWPAVEEFLKEHPEWTLKDRFTNNNGLTVLVRTV